ncbi:MAG: ABC transporter ATP-binding protein [Lachnospiraceae bacterium]|jgi:branched-chain amino acid transport system ATP-binding protein|nr:ABC transporter ATP-binding protein [Lachnospiraceae bacterium]
MSLLKVNNLSISFGGLRAVDQFNINVEKGQLYGLIGPNGAGKTTVFNLLTGVYRPNEGIVYLDGKDITNKKTMDISKEGVGRTFQNIRLFKKLSVLDNVKVGLHNRYHYNSAAGILRLPKYHRIEKEMNEEAYRLLSVFDLVGEAQMAAGNLPYGKQRKLEIARTMATNPKLLLLDEPAAGMNPNETKELMDTIKFVRDEFAMTILLIEHDMKLVAGICEELTVLNFGKILVSGKTSLVLADSRVITAYLGED